MVVIYIMMNFNFNSTEPIYLQVAEQIEDAIFTGAFKEGEQIPSTTEVSKRHHINPATVLKGMNLLVSADLIEKKRGLGMFVKKDAHEKVVARRLESFYQDYIVNIIKEAKKLKLSEDQLWKLIKRGWENDRTGSK